MKFLSSYTPFVAEKKISINKNFDPVDFQITPTAQRGGRKRKRDTEYVDYEDTIPEEYAGPVYRGSFWLISDEFAKRPDEKDGENKTPTLESSSPSAWDDDFPSQIPPALTIKPLACKPVPGRKKANVRKPKSFEDVNNALEEQPPAPVKKKTKMKRSIHRKRRNKPDDGQLVHLFCNHCNRSFQAKPTYRPKFMHYLVNHACSGLKRHQYVLGVKHRKCQFQCEPSQGCIFLTS
jgi:hypothetical protein